MRVKAALLGLIPLVLLTPTSISPKIMVQVKVTKIEPNSGIWAWLKSIFR